MWTSSSSTTAIFSLFLAGAAMSSVDAVASISHPICSSGAQCTGTFDMGECVIDSEKLLDKGMAVRFKDMRESSHGDFYAGAGDVGVAACRGNTQKHINYDHDGTAMPFYIKFTPSDEKLVTYISTQASTQTYSNVQVDDRRNDPGCTTDHTTQSGRAQPPDQWNGITFTIANRGSSGTGSIWITDVEVNGVAIGNFCGAGNSGFNFQNYLPDYDMSAVDTTITGNLVLCDSKSAYNNNENDKFEVLFLKSDTTREAECGGGGPTPSDNDCPVEQVELLKVDGETPNGSESPIQVITTGDDTVTFQVCNPDAGGSVWTSFEEGYSNECYEHVQNGPNNNCQVYTADCMTLNKIAVVNVFLENNGSGSAGASDLPRCCEAPGTPKVTKITAQVMCSCPETPARNLRGN